jgi:hypothetical protein
MEADGVPEQSTSTGETGVQMQDQLLWFGCTHASDAKIPSSLSFFPSDPAGPEKGVFGWLQADTVAAVWIAAAAIHREKNTIEAAAAAGL